MAFKFQQDRITIVGALIATPLKQCYRQTSQQDFMNLGMKRVRNRAE